MSKEEMIVDLFKCIGNPTQYKILKVLCERPLCVNKLNEAVGYSQPNISQHLKLMRMSGIVTCSKNGMNICYQIADDDIIKLLELAEDIVLKQRNRT